MVVKTTSHIDAITGKITQHLTELSLPSLTLTYSNDILKPVINPQKLK